MLNLQGTEAKYLDYGDFFTRVLARIIDSVITTPVVLGLPIFAKEAGASDEVVGFLFILAGIGVWIYEAAMHSSSKQTTLGKMALGIKVTDSQGNRISFGRATLRYFGKWLSGICGLIYLVAAFTPKNQALHDMIAGTVVITD